MKGTTNMILGLCGAKGAGKSELARLLENRQGMERTAFADPLKIMLLALFEYQGLRAGRARRMLWGDLKEEPTPLLNGRTTRWAMQTLGTEWGRYMIHQDLWVDTWTRRVKNRNLPTVAEDVRFLNEEDRIRSLGGKIISIAREGTEFDDHISEMEFLRIAHDLAIRNNATPEHMLQVLETYLAKGD